MVFQFLHPSSYYPSLHVQPNQSLESKVWNKTDMQTYVSSKCLLGELPNILKCFLIRADQLLCCCIAICTFPTVLLNNIVIHCCIGICTVEQLHISHPILRHTIAIHLEQSCDTLLDKKAITLYLQCALVETVQGQCVLCWRPARNII